MKTIFSNVKQYFKNHTASALCFSLSLFLAFLGNHTGELYLIYIASLLCVIAISTIIVDKISELKYNLQNETLDIKIKYFDKEIDKISKIEKGDWIDLRAAETVHLKAGESYLVPLGVGMKLPSGYEAYVIPRSSAFKHFGIIQTNHLGLIDESYCESTDQWFVPVYALKDGIINKNDRLCQFRIMKKQPNLNFVETDFLSDESRGGFGSTGVA